MTPFRELSRYKSTHSLADTTDKQQDDALLPQHADQASNTIQQDQRDQNSSQEEATP